MKTLKILTIFLCCHSSFAQINSNLDINGEFQTVITLEDSTVDIYQKTKDWIISSYRNPEKVIVLDEKDVIKINGYQSKTGLNPSYDYTLKIDFKENRYRITFKILELQSSGYTWTYNSYYNNKGELRPANNAKVARIKEMVDDLLNSLNKAITSSNNDDW